MPASSYRRALDVEVLEIVEDSEPEREEQRRNFRKGSHTAKGKKISVIELTDSSDSDTPARLLHTAAINIKTNSSDNAAGASGGGMLEPESHPMERSKGLNLQQFTFQHTGSSASKVVTRPPTVILRPVKVARPLSDEQSDIAPNDVEGLTACVSCEVKWTARKTSVQKLAHILSCARQHGLEIPTVKVLIHKQTRDHSSTSRGPRQPTQPAPPVLPNAPQISKTLFENVAPMIQPNKRNAQKEPPTLLSTPRSGRDAILSKARAILYDTNLPSSGLLDSASFQHHRTNDEDEVTTSDSLQFGQSLLGQRLPSNKPGFISKSYDMAFASIPTDGKSITAAEESELINHFSVLSVGLSPGDVARTVPKPQGGHYERTREQLVVQTPKKIRTSPAFDETWTAYMTDCIQKDQTLHLRILRYEPVNFDVFLKMAESYAPLTSRLRAEVRDFLDSQAIHFFGAEKIWGKKAARR